MGWSYKFWKKTFYPKDLNSSQYLKYYSSQFNSVEVNNTFYKIPNEKTVLSWKDQTPKNFIFSLKVPRKITHFRMLSNADEDTEFFLKRVNTLKEKLGPLLFQFPYNFSEKKISILQEYLKKLPKNFQYAIEVRNKNLLNEKLFSILKENNVALVWTETPFLPLIEEVTTDFIYVRWKGNRKIVNGKLGKTEVDQNKLIKKWASKLATYKEKTNRIFGYFSKYLSGNPTKDSKTLLESIKKTSK
ncbi:MAG: DUF72 domain-containing protein [Candidatus Hodarchaeales archaeon]|jgi:uncharacterized protein YecE (DUF72 family)